MQPQSKGASFARAPGAEWDQIVLRWPGLRGEPKLGWYCLWRYAGCQAATITITASDLGSWQGTSDTAGRRVLNALKGAGLIEVIATEQGRWTVYVADPREVKRVRQIRLDGQGMLFESHADEQEQSADTLAMSAAGVGEARTETSDATEPSAHSPPPRPPANTTRRATDDGSASASAATTEAPAAVPQRPQTQLNKLGPLLTSENLQAPRAEVKGLGRDDGSERASAAVYSIGNTLAERKAVDPAEFQLRLEELAASIKRRVDDPELYDGPCVRVALAILENRIRRHRIDRILDNLDALRNAGRLRLTPSHYFTRSVIDCFKKWNVDYVLPGQGQSPPDRYQRRTL